MHTENDTRHWAASAIQSGTRDRIWVEGETREAVDTKLYGRAYGAIASSVTYYRIDREGTS